MYIQHDGLQIPSDRDQKIWRYMSLAELVSLLGESALWFTKIAQLIESDPWEGAVPLSSFPALNGVYSSGVESAVKTQRDLVSVSCWCVSDHQKVAMWDRHASGTCGVAIQSTFARLCDSFANCDKEVYIGTVRYIDHAVDDLTTANVFMACYYKSNVYDDEAELRAVVSHATEAFVNPADPVVSAAGVVLNVVLNALIEDIYVTPRGSPWEIRAVQSILDKYGLLRTASRSGIADGPAY